MIYLSQYDLININTSLTLQFGGLCLSDNVKNKEALGYIVDAISATMFGAELYPTINEKAALYMYNIICNHIFNDGNKRTGLQAALVFLEANGYKLKDDVTEDELIEFALWCAGCSLKGIELENIANWFNGKLEIIELNKALE